MAAAHLALQLVRYLVRGELVPLLRDHELKGEVEQEVAHFALDGLGLSLTQRMVQLQHFLDQVGAECLPGLRPVPGTPSAEVAHHRESASKR